MSEQAIARIFEEWKRRYLADPEGFMSHIETDDLVPEEYGVLAARYYIELVNEFADV